MPWYTGMAPRETEVPPLLGVIGTLYWLARRITFATSSVDSGKTTSSGM